MSNAVNRCIHRVLSLFLAGSLLFLSLFAMDLTLETNAAATPGIVPSGFYYLKSYYGKYMTVHNGADVDGTNIYEYSACAVDDSAKQLFRFQYIESDNAYYIFAVCSSDLDNNRYAGENRVVSVDPGSDGVVTIGDNVNLQSHLYANTQKWVVEALGSSKIIMRPFGQSQRWLGCYGNYNGTSSGTSGTSLGNVMLEGIYSSFSIQWILEPYTGNHPLANGIYRFKNVNSGKYLAVSSSSPTSGSNVVQSNLNTSSSTQLWHVMKQDDYSYTITPQANTSLALNVSSVTDGTNVTVTTSNNSSQQKVRFVKNGSNYWINPITHLGKVVEVANASSSSGANITVSTNASFNAQKWVIELVTPDDVYAGLGWRYVFDKPNIYNRLTWGYKLPEDTTHGAIDIVADYTLTKAGSALSLGSRIVSPCSGTVVVNAFQADGAGNYVTIETNVVDPTNGNKIRVSFMHLDQRSQLLVGSTVNEGTFIGYLGNTGRSSGPHLHLCMGNGTTNNISANNSINPQRFFPAVHFTNKTSTVMP